VLLLATGRTHQSSVAALARRLPAKKVLGVVLVG
jgi:hypothetical protein